jgi:hypothetical protein
MEQGRGVVEQDRDLAKGYDGVIEKALDFAKEDRGVLKKRRYREEKRRSVAKKYRGSAKQRWGVYKQRYGVVRKQAAHAPGPWARGKNLCLVAQAHGPFVLFASKLFQQFRGEGVFALLQGFNPFLALGYVGLPFFVDSPFVHEGSCNL